MVGIMVARVVATEVRGYELAGGCSDGSAERFELTSLMLLSVPGQAIHSEVRTFTNDSSSFSGAFWALALRRGEVLRPRRSDMAEAGAVCAVWYIYCIAEERVL
jgi:hypothetical protein